MNNNVRTEKPLPQCDQNAERMETKTNNNYKLFGLLIKQLLSVFRRLRAPQHQIERLRSVRDAIILFSIREMLIPFPNAFWNVE